MNWAEEIDKIQVEDGDGGFKMYGSEKVPNRKYVEPKEVSYNETSLIIRGREFKVDNPRLEFARALSSFEELLITVRVGKNYIQCNNCSIGGAGFGYVKDENGLNIQIPHFGKVIIGENVTIHNNVCIDRGVIEDTVIGDGVKIDNFVHIAHNCKIGKNTLIAAGAIVCGSVEIGENCFLGVNCSIKQKVKIGNNCVIGMGSVVLSDVPDNTTVKGLWK